MMLQKPLADFRGWFLFINAEKNGERVLELASLAPLKTYHYISTNDIFVKLFLKQFLAVTRSYPPPLLFFTLQCTYYEQPDSRH